MSLSKKIHLREGERIIRIVRRYYLTDWWRYFFGLVFLCLSSFFMFQLFFYGWWGYAIYGMGILIGLYIIFRSWFLYHSTLFIITSERIVDIHRSSWFDEVQSAISHKDISDIAVRKKGILAGLFNYGILLIQTKSQQFVLEINKVKHPQELQTMLLEISELYQREQKLSNVNTIYRSFISTIPDLTDDQLNNVQRLIGEQFEEDGDLQNS